MNTIDKVNGNYYLINGYFNLFLIILCKATSLLNFKLYI